MSERWFQVLSYWQDVEFRHSLTFPFLIGALRDPAGATLGYEGKGFSELQQLVKSMQSHQASDHILHVYRCSDRDKLVVTRVAAEHGPSYGRPIPPSGGGRAVLFASHEGSGGGGTTADALISAIWSECADAVDQGRFSCRGKIFQEFDANELKFIHAALA